MTYALVHNRSEFIDFILKRGVKIKSYLTNDKLKELYNDTLESKVCMNKLICFTHDDIIIIDRCLDDIGYSTALTKY